MSNFDDIMRSANTVLFGTFGDRVIVNGVAVDAIIERNVQRTNQYGEITVNAVEIAFQKAFLAGISKGDSVQTGSATYTVSGILSDDGHVIVAIAS